MTARQRAQSSGTPALPVGRGVVGRAVEVRPAAAAGGGWGGAAVSAVAEDGDPHAEEQEADLAVVEGEELVDVVAAVILAEAVEGGLGRGGICRHEVRERGDRILGQLNEE